MSKLQAISEIVFIVKDVRASANFYREVVGLLPDTEPDEAWAWFWVGDTAQLQRIGLHKGSLLFEEHSPRVEGHRWGPVHYAFRVARADLEPEVARLRTHGIAVYGPQEFEWMQARSYYFYDLDDNLLELFSPAPERIISPQIT
ncbi:MAG: VOC family protein [Anaerolineales bacterium]